MNRRMPLLLNSLSHQIYLSAPLFILILLGYGLTRLGKWPASISEGMNRFVFNVALPCMLFGVMSHFYQSPPVDARLLLAFFGSCLLVFIVGRIVAKRLFKLDGVAGSVFALGGIFSIT
jgi:malonate transporter